MDVLLQDLRYAVRMLLRAPGLALVVTVTLAVGIGATTTMFNVVYATLLRPLPFEQAYRLVVPYVTRSSPREDARRARWSYAEIAALASGVTSFEQLGNFTQASVSLTGAGEPQQVDAELASPGYFDALRVRAVRGRTFRPEEDTTPAGHPVALISARLWQQRFAGDPGIVGRVVGVNDVALTIVGVLPADFAGLSGRADIWIPPTMAPVLTYANYLTTPQHFISVIARLRAGVTLAQADRELAVAARWVIRPEPSSAEPVVWSATVWSLGRARIDEGTRSSALVLLAAVGCVLLVACVNIAGLLLARARNRQREIAVRLALGASRRRLVRQLLTESVLLAFLGGAAGTLLAAWGVDLVGPPTILASGRNLYAQIGAFASPRVDTAVLLFSFAITLATSIVFGLAPALAATRPDLVAGLKADTRSGATRHGRVLGGLVVTQVAMAVLLLACATLLLDSFARMRDLRGGFVSDGVMAFRVYPPSSRYRPADGPAIVERLLTRIEQVPGVLSATVNRCTPFDTRCARTTVYFPERPSAAADAPMVGRHYVSADYFRTLGIPVQSGRALTGEDRAGRPPVAVVNETAARRFWGDESPIGKRVWFGSSTGFTDPARPVEIVGVVGDVKYGEIGDATAPDFYTSYLQFTYPDTIVMVKTSQTPRSLVPALRSAVASVDRSLAIYDVQTLDERIDGALSRPRFDVTVLGSFAGAALLLAAIGVYGVMAYSVTSRLHEIGVRLALGANPARLVRHVLGEGFRLAGTGAAVGLVGALAGTRLLRNLLYGVSPADPITLAIVVAGTMTVALLAAFVPARRAGAVDPMIVLRNE